MIKKKISFKKMVDIKKVASLTKILCKDYFENLPVFSNSSQSKLFKTCAVFLIIALMYISYEVIGFLCKIGQPQIFLNIYLLIMAMVIIFQQILASANVYYYSKDLEYILPYPIKPTELLLGRFNMMLSISYISILIFALSPLIIYGMMVMAPILYYFKLCIVLFLFPIFWGLVISTIMMGLMQLSKIIKNKEIFQLVVTTLLTSLFMIFVTVATNNLLSNESQIKGILEGDKANIVADIDNKMHGVNSKLMTLNPSIKILKENNILIIAAEVLKIIGVNLIAFILFIFAGKILYLKNILVNIQKINTSKNKIKIKKYKYKNNTKNKAYIKNEFREIFKTPPFLMQGVFPVIMITITFALILIFAYPSMELLMEEASKENAEPMVFDITCVATVLVMAQIVFTFSNLSITAISRKGKNASFTKYIPLSLHKQFIYMNIPQLILNTVVSITILITSKYILPEANIFYFIIMFLMLVILNVLDSELMLVVDLRKPNLDWNNETEAIKQNQNKLYHYVYTIIIILCLIYLSEVFKHFSLNLGMIIFTIILVAILLIINKIIKININKLFEKII